jgi:hypothetical protein
MKDNYVHIRNKDGTFQPTNEFKDKVEESDERIRSQIITFINDAVPDRWAIRFIPYTGEKYLIDVYADSLEDFEKIVWVTRERSPELIFSFTWQGPIERIQDKE